MPSNRSIKRARTPKGYAVLSHRRLPVVAADAIVLLSGVNFISVVKVLAAIEAMQNYAGTDANLLVDLSNVPTERCHPEKDEDADRAYATREYCEAVVDAALDSDLEACDILGLGTTRFVEPVTN